MSSTARKNTKSERVPVEAEAVLAQREKDLNIFMQQRQQIDTLIKMIAKIAESITGGHDPNTNNTPLSSLLFQLFGSVSYMMCVFFS